MTRSQVIAAAEKELGYPVAVYRFEYALKRGYIAPTTRRPDGWHAYQSADVKALVEFMRQRARNVQPACPS